MAQNMSGLPGIENFPTYISYSVGGIIIGLSNMIIFLSIARYEALRTNKVYVLIMAQSLADSINMLAFTIGGIRRTMLIFSGEHNIMYTAWQCAQVSHTIIWSFSVILANVMLTVVSLDRLFCIQSPLRYIGYTHRYTMVLAGSAYLYSFVSGAVGLTWLYATKEDQSRDIIAACLTPFVFTPIFWAFLSVIIYLLVWIGYKRQNSQISPDNEGQKYQLEHQRKYTKSLGISCLCSFCLFIVPWLLGSILNKWSYRSAAMVMYTASNLNPFANVIIYLKRHEEIRQALKGLITCKHMPTDVKAWKVNREAAQIMVAPAKPVGHRYAKQENHVNVEEL